MGEAQSPLTMAYVLENVGEGRGLIQSKPEPGSTTESSARRSKELCEYGTLGTFILRNVTPLAVHPRRAPSETQLVIFAVQCTMLA